LALSMGQAIYQDAVEKVPVEVGGRLIRRPTGQMNSLLLADIT